MTDPGKTIFDAARAAKGAITSNDVVIFDEALDRMGIARETLAPRPVGAKEQGHELCHHSAGRAGL